MATFKNETMKRQHQEKLELAKGSFSINAFAHLAQVSPSNMWKIFHGQVGKPETLQKIANARPDLEYLYEELMYTAGYFNESPTVVASESKELPLEECESTAMIPVLKNLKGSKRKLLINADLKKFPFPIENMNIKKYFFYHMETEELSPKIKAGDLLLFDMSAHPKDNDIVLFRVNKEEGLVRYFCKQNAKIIAYTSNPNCIPSYFNKGEVEILGVAVAGVISLSK